MLVADIRTERYDTMRVVRRTPRGDYIEARAPDGGEAFLYVPGDATIYAVEVERLREFRSPCVPAIREVFAGAAGSEAIRFEDVPSAVPLDSAAPLPASLIRTGLVALLSTLSHVHAHDHVHGRIAADSVFLDPSGGFWLLDWGNARRVSSEPYRRRGIQIVARDVRALGAAILSWAGRVDPGGDGEMSPEAAETASRVFAAEDPELARVLVRMASSDPMEAYEFAGEALLDLGARDLSLDNVWLELPQIGRGRMLRRIADAAGEVRRGERSVPSYVLEGGCGTGRTSALRDIARRCREAGHSVVQIEGRDTSAQWEPMASLARQLATRLPSDSPHRGAPEVRALLDAQSPGAARNLPNGSERVAEIAWGLACAARGPEVTVVLVDDEDAMPSHVLGAWRAFCAIAEAGPTDERPVRPRLVLVAATSAPQQPGDTRERHTLRCLTEREVRKLAEVLTDPPRAPVLSGPLWAVSAGRPSEIAAFLRRLDRDGVLRRMGRRWTLTVPEIGAGPEFLEDGVRRAMATISPEATRMTELLAVTGGAGARRQDIVRIADIPAHRLQAAALECERAGLASRTGDGWRIATPARAERVLAALDDDRRRALEREVLESLLDAAPSAQDPAAIARHARACNDPRAASFCRAAALAHVAALRYEEAAALLDETIATIDPAMADADLQVAYVESLIRRDRRADATARAEAALNDPDLPADIRDRIVLMTFRLSEGVLAPGALARLPLSDALHSPAVRAEVRLWRARTMALAGRIEESEREIRLAEAECGPIELLPNCLLARESVYGAVYFAQMDYEGAYRSEVRSLWYCRAAGVASSALQIRYRAYRAALQLDNEARALRGFRRISRRHSSTVRADRRLHSQLLDIEVYLEHWMGRHSRCSLRHELAHTGNADRDEPFHYLLSVAGMIQSRIVHGRTTREDRHRTRRMLWLLEKPLGRDLLFRFARCALFYGFHHALVVAAQSGSRRLHTPFDQAWLLLAACRARMIAGEALGSTLSTTTHEALSILAHALGRPYGAEMLATIRTSSRVGDAPSYSSCGVLAYSVRTGSADSSMMQSQANQLYWTGAPGAYEAEDLILTLVTEDIPQCVAQISVDPELIEQVLSRRAPFALEWRRLLWLAIRARSEHKVRDAEVLASEARLAAYALSGPELGEVGTTLRQRALDTMERRGFRTPLTRLATAQSSDVPRRTSFLQHTERRRVIPWHDVRTGLKSGGCQVLDAGGVRDVEAFEKACEDDGGFVISQGSIDLGTIERGATVILSGVDLWSNEAVVAVLRTIAAGAAPVRMACTVSASHPISRAGSSAIAALISALGGGARLLGNPLRQATEREAAVRWYWRRVMGQERELGNGVMTAMLSHTWAGGFGELRHVMEQVQLKGESDLTATALAESLGGSSGRTRASAKTTWGEVALAMARHVEGRGSASMGELTNALGIPRRTVQRVAKHLVQIGRLGKAGSGRSCRYIPST
ncbi:MAG: hypothetical protein HMLKMBBP_02891 [Planctomycetes bacterium]|nr:hypothetical protein [Planctomycetota bacterium]